MQVGLSPGEGTRGGASAAVVIFLSLQLPTGQAVAMSSASLVCASKCRPEEQ